MVKIFNTILKNGKEINFHVRPFNFLNFDLRETFNSDYPTIVALYKRDRKIKTKLRQVNIKVIENPIKFFRAEPIPNELREVVVVLLLNEPLPSSREHALEYLEKLNHEIIDSLPSFLEIDQL